MLKGTVIVVLALTLFAPLGLWINRHWSAPSPDPTATRSLFAVPDECRPEPGERFVYLSGLLFIPAGIFVLAHNTPAYRLSERFPGLKAIDSSLFAVSLVWFAMYALSGDKDDAGHGYYHLRFNFFREHPFALIGVPIFLLLATRRRLRAESTSKWFWPLLGAVVLVPWAGSIFSDQWFYAGKWHFNAVFDSVVRVHFGKTLLVESTCQYGLYAWFLSPIFRCVGLSVAKFTAVIGLLTATCYWMIGLFLKRQTTNPWIAAVGVLATLFNGWMLFLTVEGPQRGNYLDLYFQYVPLRLLVPALLLGLGGCWIERPSKHLGRLIWLLLACGLLWNLDSGVPALAAWSLTLVYTESAPNRPRGRALRLASEFATALMFLVAVFGVYALWARWAAGSWPDFSLLFRSQYIFYANGFAMLPMPWPGTWMAVIAIYLAGIACAAIEHARGVCSSRSPAIFLISSLGLLLFSYYQGRSHRAVLILAWWPIFPLLTLFLDTLVEKLKRPSWRLLPVALTGCIPAAILLGSAASFFEHLNMVGDNAGRQLASLAFGGPVSFTKDAAILSNWPDRAAQLWIISPRESILHLAAGRRQLAPCSFNELLLMADYQTLTRKLADNPDACIWIDRIDLEMAISQHLGVRAVADLLAISYEPVAVGEHGWLFRRRSKEAPKLDTLTVTARFRATP
jgi:hypothetical protein